MRIFEAASRLFGPGQYSRRSDEPGKTALIPHKGGTHNVGDAGVAAALIALAAKLAKADGHVSREEIDTFRNIFQPKLETQKGVSRFFDLARQTTLGYEAYAKIVYRHYRKREDILEDIIDGLFHIALADGVVSDEEMAFIETVGRIFKLTPQTFYRIQVCHLGQSVDDPYVILGVDVDISDQDLKKAYHKLAADNHPDRMLLRDLPPEMQTLATRKMASINQAYAKILQLRKKDAVMARMPHG